MRRREPLCGSLPRASHRFTAGTGLAGGGNTTFGEDLGLINNRQGGRRRGRGGGGSGRQPNGSPGPGNRQENRQRGNAAQLLEKYKSMARDAQMQGDRVLTENYLQFADHYFRVLNENRPRFEEPRRQRDDFGYDEDEDQDETVGAEAGEGDGGDNRQERYDRNDRQDRDERPVRQDRQERYARDDRGDRGDREDARPDRDARPQGDARPERDLRNGDPRRNRPRRDRYEAVEESEERISLDVLPPAIAAVPVQPDGGDAPAKAPRRRGRPPRDESDEIAPAA